MELTSQQALRVAIRELGKLYRAEKRDVMADPRAEELRAIRLHELDTALFDLVILLAD